MPRSVAHANTLRSQETEEQRQEVFGELRLNEFLLQKCINKLIKSNV